MIDCRQWALTALGIVLLCSAISACSIRRGGDQLTFETDKQYLEERLCAGLYEIEQPLRNGSGQVTTAYYELATGQKFNDPIEFMKAESAREIAYIDAENARHLEYIQRQGKRSATLAETMTEIRKMEAVKEFFQNVTGKEFEAETSKQQESLKRELAELDRRVGIKPFVASPKNQVSKNYLAPRTDASLQGIQEFHVMQSSPESCWAASLETAFRYLGYSYTQENFIASLRSTCSRRRSKSASLNQMMFSASNLYANGKGGVWLGRFPSKQYFTVDLGELSRQFLGVHFDYNSVYGVPPPKPVVTSRSESNFNVGGHQFGSLDTGEYTSAHIVLTERAPDGKSVRKGKIKIISETAELIQAVYEKNPVIVGRRVTSGGHTVVVTDITYRPGGDYDAVKRNYEMDYRALLESVIYLDPSRPSAPPPMSGDEFLRDVVFAFYIERPK